METHLSVLMVQRKAEKRGGGAQNGALKHIVIPRYTQGLVPGPNSISGWLIHAYRNRGYRGPAALLLRVNSTGHGAPGFLDKAH